MSETPQVAVSDARKEIGKLIDAAHYAGQHTILAKNDEPRAVLVPYQWYIEQQNRPV
ncbi:type II toxin-antitoxin system Phd/YefM family antitoxin [Actinoplanes sp. NPDC049599]|uniref:type II toxin-antitoxin system Phd/YefM family antitoxin n=1 Tax=Actinoplanes sp. NPDC049599 TaxID=3363903 RepID=UPI0037A41F5B